MVLFRNEALALLYMAYTKRLGLLRNIHSLNLSGGK